MRTSAIFLPCFGLCLALPWALAVAASAAWGAAAEPAWQPSADGASVADPLRKLAWDRCVDGQQWQGRACMGEVRLHSYGEAVALAGERNRTEGARCRLPTVAELQALATQAAAKPLLFPAVEQTWRWSGTRNVDTAPVNQYNYGNVMQGRNDSNAVRVDVLNAWAVDIDTGASRKDMRKRTRLPVQLVCPLP